MALQPVHENAFAYTIEEHFRHFSISVVFELDRNFILALIQVAVQLRMMTSSNGNIFRVTGHLCVNSPVPGEFPHKGQWRGALMFSLICVWINDWVNKRGHYDVNVREHLHVAIQRNNKSIVTSKRRRDVVWRNKDVISTSCVCWDVDWRNVF